MKQPPRRLRSTTAQSQTTAATGEIDNNSTIKSYKKIFTNKKCQCPFGCYLCGKILGVDLVRDVYKRNWILNEVGSSVFSIFGKDLVK